MSIFRETLAHLAYDRWTRGDNAFATDKTLTPQRAQHIHNLVSVTHADPEWINKSSGSSEYSPEPESIDPVKAIIFKLLQLKEHYQVERDSDVAGDVVFLLNGVQKHRRVRSTRDLSVLSEIEQETLAQEVVNDYAKPSLAQWNIAFGLNPNPQAEELALRTVTCTVSAVFPEIDEQTVRDNLLLTANTGVKLVELGKKLSEMGKPIQYILTLSNGTQQLISFEEAYQLIVEKVPTQEMMENMLAPETSNAHGLLKALWNELNAMFSEMRQRPERWGLFGQALAAGRSS